MATVLVVDDAAFMRMMLSDILVEHGHRVVGEAGDGEAGVELYAALRPDLVTLDVVMPKKNGIEALEAILRGNPGARVVMVSSVAQEEIARKALKLGARAYVIKPFRPDHVKECVDAALTG